MQYHNASDLSAKTQSTSVIDTGANRFIKAALLAIPMGRGVAMKDLADECIAACPKLSPGKSASVRRERVYIRITGSYKRLQDRGIGLVKRIDTESGMTCICRVPTAAEESKEFGLGPITDDGTRIVLVTEGKEEDHDAANAANAVI